MIAADKCIDILPFVFPKISNDANGFEATASFVPSNMPLLKFGRLWRFGGATAAAMWCGADLMFSPSCTAVTPGLTPTIVTIHDVTPVLMPSYPTKTNLILKFLLWASAKFSRKTITDSECSKRDLMQIYGLSEDRVSVVYLGFDKQTFNTSEADILQQRILTDRYGIYEPYIFHHGVIQPRKNLERLIQAFEMVLRSRPNRALQLVLAGPVGWQYESILRAAYALHGKVILTGPLPDRDLALLIKGASLCAIPSLYEGFCLPMVEAMACGVPTVASNTSCLPEVSAGVLRYFDPLCVEHMAETIELVLGNDSIRHKLVRDGVKRAAEFSWERCARETLAALMSTNPEPLQARSVAIR